MQALQKQAGEIPRKLDPQTAKLKDAEKIALDEPSFHWVFNEDAMATEKLAEEIRNFIKDTMKLEHYLTEICRDC